MNEAIIKSIKCNIIILIKKSKLRLHINLLKRIKLQSSCQPIRIIKSITINTVKSTCKNTPTLTLHRIHQVSYL
jgi:hypothetical protein